MLKHLFAKTWLRWVLGIAVVAVGGGFIFGSSAPVVYDSVAVTRGSVTETVTGTGQIKPKSYASLRFKTSGIVARLNVDVGDVISTGQVLATLDASDLARKVTQAQADLAGANVELANAKQALTDQHVKGTQAATLLYANVPNKFNDVLNLSQQAYASFATFYDSSNRLTGSIAGVILNSQLVTDTNNAKAPADNAMKLVKVTLENFPPGATQEQIDSALTAVHKPLQDLQASLTTLINAVAAIPTGAISAATLDTYKTTLATAQTNLNSAISSETNASANLQDTEIQNGLTVNAAQATERTAEANLEKAKAALSIAEQNLSDAYLRAPISGVVATKSKQIGELVTSADQVYYLLGNGGLEVVANIPEVDVARITVGGEVTGTLDAFSSAEQFALKIDSIDPDQTTIDGVVYYKTHFSFTKTDPRFRSGMTVNLTMIANHKENVLVIPRRAVTQKGKGATVRILPTDLSATPEVREIKVGLKGDTQVEVESGLAEGETVITGEKK